MRIATIAGMVFICSVPAALAQVFPLSVDGGQVVRTASPACPLNMHVRQRAGGTLLSTDVQGRRVETFAARLRLELTNPLPDRSSQRMESATVTVQGWSAKE